MTKTCKLLAAASMLLLSAACVRRPLEYLPYETVRVIVDCIYEDDAYPVGEKPTGMTLYFFRDGKLYNTVTTSNIDTYETELPAGNYKLYMMSQSVDEFGSMTFSNMDNFDKAAATLTESKVTWATRGTGEVVGTDPEVLLAGTSAEFEVTEAMIHEYQIWHSKKKAAVASGATKGQEWIDLDNQVEQTTIHVPVYPKNVTSELEVLVYCGGMSYLQNVRASTTGMARTFVLTPFITGDETATQVIRYWGVAMDREADDIGHLYATITTFGLPNGDKPSPNRDATLNITTLLVDNNTTLSHVFEVGDKFVEITPPTLGYRHHYLLTFGTPDEPVIIFPEVDPVEAGGGFVAGVTDWDEEVEGGIEI